MLCLATITAESESTTVCILYQDISSLCSIECSTTYDVTIDKEIEFNDNSDIDIHFCSPSILLHEVAIIFTNITNLLIGSASNKTSITGKGGSGFHLKNVNNVSILQVEFIECGKTFEFDPNYTVFAAMLIENSSDVKLDNVVFTNSNGSGLIMLNIAGNSMLINCSFKNSTSTNAQRTKVTQSCSNPHRRVVY